MTESQGRRWGDEDKRAVCQEALEGSLPVAQVAKRHGIRKARLYYWLKDPRYNPTLEGSSIATTGAGFVSVRIVEENMLSSAVVNAEQAEGDREPLCLENRLAGGHHVHLSGPVNSALVAQILRELCT
ncbi:Transposase [Pseudovibrio axinellae]|uniref:Transposase n=1 Tax=Pseudovibrio axinellae TaxID=989403 RepID=A0A165Y3E8_9HYPH|nr:transposase [Pseudovibrio axinellae]KZL18398.1 Transposase [Pseudovibrio axinellae]SER70300.1 Transposase [Pseudovibrio axinellae]